MEMPEPDVGGLGVGPVETVGMTVAKVGVVIRVDGVMAAED